MKLGIDVNRHKEIIVKSVSAILLLLLKHFKVHLSPFGVRMWIVISSYFLFRSTTSISLSSCLNT